MRLVNDKQRNKKRLAGGRRQGTLRASDIMCLAIMEAGLDVKKSEVHGMAQRGGCVTSHVRYGKKVCILLWPGWAPLICLLRLRKWKHSVT